MYVQEFQTIDDSQLISSFSQAFQDAWKERASSVREEFIEIMKSILSSRIESWSVSQSALERYPFLSDKSAFVVAYVECFEVIVRGTTFEFVINAEKAVQKGFPENIDKILEYGEVDLEALPHYFETCQKWEQIKRDRFLKSVADLAVENMPRVERAY